jgi:WhiB family redox-sensing transcriptional regulator
MDHVRTGFGEGLQISRLKVLDDLAVTRNQYQDPTPMLRPHLESRSHAPDVPAGREPTWEDFANCLGSDPYLFFPMRGESACEAKEACRGCVVREECLEHALSVPEKFGIWGGLSERERRRIRRQRALARAAG